MQWPTGQGSAGLRIEQSGFKPCPWSLWCEVLGKTLLITLIVPLSIQVYKWIPAKYCRGVTLRWTSIPSGGGGGGAGGV